MKVGVRTNSGEVAIFEQAEDATEVSVEQWVALAKEANPAAATILVQVK